MSQIQAFNWGEIALSQTVFIENIPHATKQAIGEWLEYADPRPSINKIIERNPHINDYSVGVNLTSTDSKNYDTRVYHPIGFLLIVMESGQQKAQAMKVAVAEFVWHFAGPKKINFKQEMELMKLQRNLLSDLTKTRDSFARKMLSERLGRVCLELGQPMPDIALLGKDAKQLEMGV